MSDNVTILGMDDDDDKTVFQTDEDRKQLETEILDLNDDDDTTGTKLSPRKSNPARPYWQQLFG